MLSNRNGLREKSLDLRRKSGSSDVDIGNRVSEKEVTDNTACEDSTMSGISKRLDDRKSPLQKGRWNLSEN